LHRLLLLKLLNLLLFFVKLLASNEEGNKPHDDQKSQGLINEFIL
jgi:hypothetical protein